jgi:hypothetical protein
MNECVWNIVSLGDMSNYVPFFPFRTCVRGTKCIRLSRCLWADVFVLWDSLGGKSSLFPQLRCSFIYPYQLKIFSL